MKIYSCGRKFIIIMKNVHNIELILLSAPSAETGPGLVEFGLISTALLPNWTYQNDVTVWYPTLLFNHCICIKIWHKCLQNG